MKYLTVSIVSPSIYHEMMGLGAMLWFFFCFFFLMLSFKPAFSLSSFIKRLFSSSSHCCNGGVICISEVIDIFSQKS